MSKENSKTKNDAEEANRMWASASFVGILIIVGLPLWWKTTEVYRVALPYKKINAFQGLPHAMTTELTILADDEKTAELIARPIEVFFSNYEYLTVNIKRSVLSDALHHALSSTVDEEAALKTLGEYHDLSKPNTMLIVQKKMNHNVWMGDERAMFFKSDNASNTVLQVLTHWVYQTSVLTGARSDVADLARRIRFPPSDSYHIVLTVIHPRPDAIKVQFDATNALENYIGSFVDELSDLHNFTLKSQWLYMMEFDFQAKEVRDASEWGRHSAVRQERLPLLLTSAEQRAATRSADTIALNLAMYIAHCEIAPLIIYDNDDKPVSSPVQAFMSPKWGGVFLGNPTVQECQTEKPVYKPPVRTIMGTFVAQLRELLGINDATPIKDAYLVPLRSVRPRRWETDRLLRLRTLEHLTAAENTLRSLSQLLGEISNIVINDDVGASINQAVDSIHQSVELMKLGKVIQAYQESLRANNAAETAFTDPSLLALLYFPDDQKYAIYIPLFLPIMFPVILSLKTLITWFRGEVKEKMD